MLFGVIGLLLLLLWILLECSGVRNFWPASRCAQSGLCALARRLILFLQQSSVEWASSLWLNVLQEVDPGFTRTVGFSKQAKFELPKAG